MSGTAIIAYLVLTISVGYAFIYPAVGEINALSGQRQKYLDTLEMVSKIESKKSALLTEFDAIPAADKESIDTVLPTTMDFVRLVSQIDAVAAGHGISIDSITSKQLAASAGTSISDASPEKPYQSSAIGFSFTASYDKFNDFLSDLEKSMRILDIRSAKLDPQETGVYQYDVEFETYWLK